MALLADLVEAAQDRPVLAIAIFGVLLSILVKAATPALDYPALPWIGRDDSKFFALTRATFASAYNVKNMLAEGYQKVG